MQIRTDLALEQREIHKQETSGIKSDEYDKGGVSFSKIQVLNDDGKKALNKPVGTYITAMMEPFSSIAPDNENVQAVADELAAFIPKNGTVLVAGLGNTAITPDALGPKTAFGIFSTRHIGSDLAKAAGLEKARSVAAIAPGVLGQTGIETAEIVKGVVERIKPSAIIAVDALASRKMSRLGCTVQITDSGIEPGAGVGNARNELSLATLGIPVIAVGIPTVVDASTLVYDITGSDNIAEPDGRKMIVTPREIDLIIGRASKFLANCINLCLQPELDSDFLAGMLE